MKHLLTLLLLVCTCSVANSQTAPRERREIWGRQSKGVTFFVGTSPFSVSSYGAAAIFPYTLSVDKRINDHFSWMASLGVEFRVIPVYSRYYYRYEHTTYNLDAKIGWVSNRWRTVFLRATVGVSALFATVERDVRTPEVQDSFFPCFVAELYLGFRLGKRCELLISPLVYAPSAMRYSPREIGPGFGEYMDFSFAPFIFGIKF